MCRKLHLYTFNMSPTTNQRVLSTELYHLKQDRNKANLPKTQVIICLSLFRIGTLADLNPKSQS